jgi:hypothetical protein
MEVEYDRVAASDVLELGALLGHTVMGRYLMLK